MTRLFDQIARLCSEIINASEDGYLFVRYSCISDKANQALQQKLLGDLPFLCSLTSESNENIQKVCQLSYEMLDDALLDSLEQYTEELYHHGEYFAMICLLRLLDESLESMMTEIIREYQSDSFSVVLNTNREVTGIGILPRTSCVWERKHRLSLRYDQLESYLFHILLLDNRILGELIDKHYFLNRDLFPRFDETKSLKVALSPLRLEPGYETVLYERNMVQYCRVHYTGKDYRRENDLIWQKILSAAENHSDLVVFPELLGNPDMEKDISQRLRELNEEEQQKMPSLIVLPSLWENHRNSVIILDHHGNTLCQQTKQNPFRLLVDGKGYLEDIKTNLVVNIFHHEGIGRIAVLVCRDFLTTQYMEQLMRCFKLTLMLVPSYSTGSYDFRKSFDLCANDDCNVIWINSCAALEKGKEANFENIGYVRKRIGRYDDESQKLCKMPICQEAFEGKCTHDCLFFETIRGV